MTSVDVLFAAISSQVPRGFAHPVVSEGLCPVARVKCSNSRRLARLGARLPEEEAMRRLGRVRI